MFAAIDPSSVAKLAPALLLVQKEIGEVEKTADNPYFESKYADLSSVIDALKPVLNKHGFTFLQFPVPPPFEGYLALTTMLLHESGESISGTAVVPLSKSDPQAFGSAMSYARRYSLVSILGLKQKDDDGNAASDPAPRTSGGLRAPAEKKAGGFPQKTTAKGGFPKGNAAAPQRAKGSLFPKVKTGKKEDTEAEAGDATEGNE